MKHVSFLLFLGLYTRAEPLLVISLMVKNEEHVMRMTLEPFLQAGLQHYVIYDTGSTDNTLEVSRELFKKYDLTDQEAYIIQEPFVDFSTSRNRALDLVDEKFPEAVFTLMVDAEWYMHNVPGLIDFCEQHRLDNHAVYLIHKIFSNNSSHMFEPRLIRTTAKVGFVGDVHEQLGMPPEYSKKITSLQDIMVPETIYIEWSHSERGINQSYARWNRDKDLLLNRLETQPNEPRTLFYLAQTYKGLGDLHNAYKYHTRRIALGGDMEEKFLAYCALGEIADKLSATDPLFTWATALNHYVDAFSYRPSRIEPLIAIALHYYRKNDMATCYIFARRAVEIPFPSDFFVVRKLIYDLDRYVILSACAGWVGELDIGEWATRIALNIEPDNMQLKDNLAEYQRLRLNRSIKER